MRGRTAWHAAAAHYFMFLCVILSLALSLCNKKISTIRVCLTCVCVCLCVGVDAGKNMIFSEKRKEILPTYGTVSHHSHISLLVRHICCFSARFTSMALELDDTLRSHTRALVRTLHGDDDRYVGGRLICNAWQKRHTKHSFRKKRRIRFRVSTRPVDGSSQNLFRTNDLKDATQ